MELRQLTGTLDALGKNLESAKTVRERIRISDRIYDALARIEKEVERFIIQELVQKNGKPAPIELQTRMATSDRFANMKIADAARVLLQEHGVLHGKEIEQHLKEGGYVSKSQKFQPTMVVAFNRAGGFQNIGRNRWKLKEK